MARNARTPYAAARLGLAAALAVLALALAGGARADLGIPTITLGTISLADGTVTLSGSVDGAGAEAQLQVNGKPVGVGVAGSFSASIDLGERQEVVLSLTGQDEKVTISIPLTALETDGGAVLDALEEAGVTIDLPQQGFKITDGTAPLVTGTVTNEKSLTSLTVNGTDVLGRLGPGGSFSTVPNSSSAQSGITVVATDTRGVSQTSTFSVTNVRSVIRTRAGTSVSAAGARGIVIAKIRFDKSRMKAKKRVGVVVTVKDRRGMLIRGAALRLTGKPLRYLAGGAIRAGFTNRIGKATFTYRLKARAFANSGCTKLTVTVRASTPTAAAKKRAKLSLPALAH